MGSPFDNHLVDDEKFMTAAAETARKLRSRIAELEADIAFVRAKIGEYVKSGCDPDMMAPTIDDIRHYLKLEVE